MANLLSLTITAAITTPLVTPTFVLNGPPRNLLAQFVFIEGSGGTTVDAYLQTSLDGGVTWIDIANFHPTTSSLSRILNFSAGTPITSGVVPGDGTLAANTAVDGILGSMFRVKYKSSGTYAGGTTLAVDVQSGVF